MNSDCDYGEIFFQKSEIQNSLVYGPGGPYGAFIHFNSTKEVLKKDNLIPILDCTIPMNGHSILDLTTDAFMLGKARRPMKSKLIKYM